MRLAFWNVNERRSLPPLLATNIALDAIALAECPDPSAVLAELRLLDPDWRQVAGTGVRRQLFVRNLPGRALLGSLGRWSIVSLGADEDACLIVIVHLRSRMHATPSHIGLDTVALRDDILKTEAQEGHRRTVVIGDFNLDPFDLGLCDRRLLLGVMDRRLAVRLDGSPTARDAIFYNPMWSRLGDDSRGPPGTYYRSGDDHHDYFFHTFDQVLVRPGLVDRLRGVDVLRRLGAVDLVSPADRPRPDVASDHLPLVVELSRGGSDEQ